MKRSTLAVSALAVLLILSNVYWLYRAVGARAASEEPVAERREALTQLFALIPVLVQKGDRARIIATAADAPSNKAKIYEKDGYVWVGSLGFRFNDTGQLVEIVTIFDIWNSTPSGKRHSTGMMLTP